MRGAFSLIEVLVALAILGVVSVAGSLVLQGSLRADTLLRGERANIANREEALILRFAGHGEETALLIADP